MTKEQAIEILNARASEQGGTLRITAAQAIEALAAAGAFTDGAVQDAANALLRHINECLEECPFCDLPDEQHDPDCRCGELEAALAGKPSRPVATQEGAFTDGASWASSSEARDGGLYACVDETSPLVTYAVRLYAQGEWWDPDRGATCDEPDLILQLPALPADSEADRG